MKARHHLSSHMASCIKRRRALHFWCGIVVGACVHMAAHAVQDWPSLPLPPDLRVYPVGNDMVVNGVPARIQGFASDTPPARLAAQFRATLGASLVETAGDHETVLGRPIDGHYLTIQLRPTARGSRGWISLVRQQSSDSDYRDAKASLDRQLARLPVGSRMLNHLTSNDAGKIATHMMVTNDASLTINVARIKHMMQADGLQLNSEMPSPSAGMDRGDSSTLTFTGNGKEATAQVNRDRAGRTLVLLNSITHLKERK